MDVNGDGIPDRIFLDSNIIKIQLVGSNTFSSPINLIDLSSVSKPSDLAYSLSTGFNLSSILESNFSFGLNFGFNANGNGTNRTFRDLNGDGLVDIFNNGTALLNNNGNFDNLGQTLTIPTLQNDGSNKSIFASGDLSYYHGFSICCLFLQILYIKFGATLGGNANLSINANEKDFRDLNGDGFLDYIGDNELFVRYSEIKRTNKLKIVINPLQGSFTLDYQPIKKTVDNPHAKWVLSSVSINDGYDIAIAGKNDGADTYVKNFEYQGAYYDRREREFYGFETVITKDASTIPTQPFYRKKTDTFHNKNYFLNGLLKYTVVQDATNLLSLSENTYQLRKLDASNQNITATVLPDNYDVGGREGRRTAAVLLTKTKSVNYEASNSLTNEVTFQYDNKGRVTQYNYWGKPNDTIDDYYSTVTYHQDTQLIDKNILNIPQEIKVFDNLGQQKRKRSTSNIDLNTGKIGAISSNSDNGIITSEYEFYPNGNLKKVTTPPNNSGTQQTFEYQYDTATQKYVTQIIDNIGYTTSTTYDPKFDKILTSTDISGNEMRYTYDTFGRTSTIRGPKEIANNKPYTIKFSYFPVWNSSFGYIPNSTFVPVAKTEHYDPQNPDNTIDTFTFIDGLGRPIIVKKDIESTVNNLTSERVSVSGLSEYDLYGRVVKSYHPRWQSKNNTITSANNYICTNASQGLDYFTETKYDTEDRAIETKDFDFLNTNSITNIQYSIENDFFKTRSITKQSSTADIIAESYTDVNGRTIKTKQIGDQTLETLYSYNAIGELLSYTDAAGITTSYQYDILGRKTTMTHPDSGTTNYYYDDRSNLTKLVTANMINQGQGDYIQFFHDNANRLVNQTFPIINGNTNIANTTFEYAGPSNGNNTGRLIKQIDASGEQEFEYGNMGELISNKRTIYSPSQNIGN
jgi:YD repeat-containing protein